MLGFQLGELPVKYLGVPLISTKLSYEDCRELIEKVTRRVKSWIAKHLSYAGRVVLIKSILFSIQVFWSIHFILPKRVIKVIEQVLRRYLWSGVELKKWGSKVAWDDVCKPKEEGGLGIRRLCEWNKASMMRHIWALCSKKPSLWVEWCHANILKGKCFWEASPPSDCSWSWRKLMKLREEAQGISKYEIGDGNSISLWYANWHPLGPLIPKYGDRIAYDAGLPKNAKASMIVGEQQWKWPFPCTWELREVIHEHPPRYMPNPEAPDKFIWTTTKHGEYSAASTWRELRQRRNKVTWHHLVWYSHHIPRHSFILWLAIKEKLNTKERMLTWGLNLEPSCVLCGYTLETLDHLFFQCPFAAQLRSIVLKKCLIVKATQPWSVEVSWAVGKFSSKDSTSLIRKVAWACMVYHLWEERNLRIFKMKASSIASIVQKIEVEVRTKLTHINMASVDTRLAQEWGLKCN